MPRVLVCFLAICCVAAAYGCRTANSNDEADGPIAARIGEQVVSVAELDAFIKDELFDRETRGGNPSRTHEVRAQAVRQLVRQRAIERAAEERGTTPEALLESERVAQDVSEQEVSKFYADNRAQLRGATLEQAAPRIREHLAHEAAVESILDSVGYEVMLEQPRVEVRSAGPSKGPDDAPVTIIEYSDFQCPYCQRALPLIEHVTTKYPEQVRVVYRHLPLDSIHPQARAGAEAAACAGDAGKFWEYHDLLFENARAMSGADLRRYAAELGIDAEAFDACLSSRKHAETVQADVLEAQAIGITGTPAFVVNGIVLYGLQSPSAIDRVIEEELGRLGS